MRSITSAEVLVVDDSLTDAELTIHALKIGEVMPTAIWISSADEALLYMFRAKHYAAALAKISPTLLGEMRPSLLRDCAHDSMDLA